MNTILKKIYGTIPKFTPHVCRDTFCTRQLQKRLNVKIIQALMGYACFEITMDTYTHATYQDIVKEVNQAMF